MDNKRTLFEYIHGAQVKLKLIVNNHLASITIVIFSHLQNYLWWN